MTPSAKAAHFVKCENSGHRPWVPLEKATTESSGADRGDVTRAQHDGTENDRGDCLPEGYTAVLPKQQKMSPECGQGSGDNSTNL